ncbi:MAG: hypothetical protein CMG61_04760 [Candidatus Marinimicrobia bacterium]|nr:hypothetical protein [Candidatus Neomarinimicrobiota bacterium]
MKNILGLILILSFNLYANDFNGLIGEYEDSNGRYTLKIIEAGGFLSKVINGNYNSSKMYTCEDYESYRYVSYGYPKFKKNSWTPPYSFIMLWNDNYCEYSGSVDLFVIIKNNGVIFDNYSKIVYFSNVRFSDIPKYVDGALDNRRGKVLYK